MVRFLLSSVLLLTVALSTSSSQETKDAPTKEDAKKKEAAPKIVPNEVEVRFRDGCIIRMSVQTETLDIATTYGTLAVPVKDVLAIEFGLHYPAGVAAKIEAAVQKLGSLEFRERDKASKTLVELGPLSYPAMVAARNSTDLEIVNRAKDVIKQLQANHSKKELRTSSEDKLVTPRFTIVGNIITPKIKATTELFGPVELSLAKMLVLRLRSPGRQQEVTVSVDAAKYANAGQWMDSGFESDGGTKVVITATGSVDTWPQQPGQWLVGPGGQNGGNIVFAGRGGIRAVKGQIVPQVHGGVLFGRIGEDGEPFMIGAHHEGTLENEGKLYLHIGPSPWGGNSAGEYEVKIARAN